MAVEKINIETFLELFTTRPVLDVRSPGEYSHAHIPGAYSLPLFTDEERKVVGTAYKKEGREKAIKIGLRYFGSRMPEMVEQAEQICAAQHPGQGREPQNAVLVHCWRGGMRSAGLAWLLDLYGFKVCTLSGGYKIFRRWVLEQFNQPLPLQILGGYTGSGKTVILQALRAKGETVIDLEALAGHKGSAFGNLDEIRQPTQEFFENQLALALYEARRKNTAVWMEDESQRIGEVNIPGALFRLKQTAPMFFLEIPFEERLEYLLEGYGKYNPEKLAAAILRIKKRLGPLETKTALAHLQHQEMAACFSILLKYYDKVYLGKAMPTGETLPPGRTLIPCPQVNAQANAELILKSIYQLQTS